MRPIEINLQRLLLFVFSLLLLASVPVHALLPSVVGEYRSTFSLDGAWETLPIAGLTFTYPPPETGWTPTTVPCADPSSLSTPNGPYRPKITEILADDGKSFRRQTGIAAWFRRSFDWPSNLAPSRIILHFDGMAFKSQTWLNGARIGDCSIGQIAQDYDVTALVKPGQTNTLVVGLAAREAIVDLAAKSYTAPASGVTAGIWGHVALNLMPETSIDDVTVVTSVRQKQLTLTTTLFNSLPAARPVTLDGVVTDEAGETQCLISPQAVTLTAGQPATVTVTTDWIAPHPWTPENPALYFVRLRLKDGGQTIDEKTQRFGFREFWIQGRDFYLNGQRITLRRNSLLDALSDDSEKPDRDIRQAAGRPFNTIRLHIGFDNAHELDAADRYGVMTEPEVAWYGIGQDYPPDKSGVWLPNLLTYEHALIRANRDHPSVILWNLANECFWYATDPPRMKVADALVAAAAQEDPTRPVEGDGETTWGGRLPIIDVHYPEWDAGDVRAKYPDSSFVAPNDLYWLKDDKTPSHGWRADFTWDRPLMIGEYWCLDGGPDEKSSFMGEAAYDWEKWRWQDMTGRDSLPDNPVEEMVKMTTDAYRVQGVAGLNPWSGDRQDVMPPLAVRPLDFHPNYYAGQTGTREFAVFNDSGTSLAPFQLQCSLSVNGVTTWQNNVNVPNSGDKPAVFTVAFPCPLVSASTLALLHIRLWQAGISGLAAYGPSLSHLDLPIHIMPAPRWTAAAPSGVVLFDPSGATAKALSTLGLTVTPRKTIAALDLKTCRLLIVGQGVDAAPARAVISDFVNRGGRALLLSVANPNQLATELPAIDTKHAASRVWLRSHDDPSLGGLAEDQLSYWQPDNLVCADTAFKPTSGKYKILLDAGGLYGLKWTPLVEVAHGSGWLVLSQLNLVDRIGVEPAADQLLLSLIRSQLDAAPVARHSLHLLVGNNAGVLSGLAACSVATTAGLAGDGPVLMDASYTPSPLDVKTLQARLLAGGVVWLHGFTPDNISKVAPLFPFPPALALSDSTVLTAARRSDDPWMDSLSNYDFAWAGVDLSARQDYFAGAKATAPIGKYELVPPSPADAVKLLAPGFLYKVPVGHGTIFFDTLGWDAAFGSETEKATRILTSLVLNLGGDIVVKPPTAYHYVTTDLSAVANRGYYDEVAGDGQGGWTDQGPNDMRYFLINHTGKVGGMEVPTAAFPAEATFADRPFALVDPKKNNGKAVVVLRGLGHDTGAPAQAMGIQVGCKADKLWFLNTACWIPSTGHDEVARYLIHYADGTTVPFPLRAGIEIADWWSVAPATGCKVGWSGKNDVHAPVVVYVTEWTNPFPDKPIATVDLIGGTTPAQIMLLGITAGQAQGEVARATPVTTPVVAPAQTVAEWDFTKATAGTIPSTIPGIPDLEIANGPVKPTVDPAGGLHFQGGAAAYGTVPQLPGLGDATPWTLSVDFTPNSAPSAFCGGIFEAMDYLKSGMRLTLKHDMRLMVEMEYADGTARYLQSKAPLVLGQAYRARVVFDGTNARLFLNGVLDNSVVAAPPSGFSGAVKVGRASGNGYNFDGVVRRVTVSSGVLAGL